ncbi:nucleotidyltransferase domain-containing protein [Opitutales bacterium]|nr:nucleotidyltransferase domain-containing protein [Opitutales bacterium]
MRLTQQEQKVICDSINRVDPEARILLFGSRVDDQARGGGDIDILCLSSEINRQQRRLIRREMGDRLAGQKIDLVIAPDSSKPFVRLVMAEAVPLTVSL